MNDINDRDHIFDIVNYNGAAHGPEPILSLIIETRPSWTDYFMAIAQVTATRSTCPRRAVGAVIVKDKRIIATGYNGAPASLDHCPTDSSAGHPSCMEHGHCVRTIHAEMNAIIACAAAGVSATGAVLYATTCPCPRCMGAIVNARIGRVVYDEAYSDPSHPSDAMKKTLALAEQAALPVLARSLARAKE